MFDVAKVTSVYSGRKGCACGCRGKYAYATAFKDKRPSYYDADECVSDRTVQATVRKVENLLRGGTTEEVMVTDDFIAVDLAHDRTYTLYFA